MRSHYVLILILAITFSSCLKDSCDRTSTYIHYDPVYIALSDIRKPRTAEEPRLLKNPGKIYHYKNLILINEVRKGIHLIDNTDPKNPNPISFIPIPGNTDFAMKDDILYANRYRDLIAMDFTTLSQPRLIFEHNDLFVTHFPLDRDQDRILAYFEKTEVTTEVECSSNNWGEPMFFTDRGQWAVRAESSNFSSTLDVSSSSNGAGGQSQPNVGTGGSMARFTITHDYLYAIDSRNLFSFNITNASTPVQGSEVRVNGVIETIFPANDHLFIGGERGMYIYQLTQPDQPTYRSEFVHALACDPVVVQGDKAYITLRGGTRCDNFVNQLDIVDISDLDHPRLRKSHQMLHPHGLSIFQNELIICEGTHGWKSIYLQGDNDITMANHIKGVDSYDVIRLSESHLLLVGKDGFYQYDISSLKEPQLLSVIEVNE